MGASQTVMSLFASHHQPSKEAVPIHEVSLDQLDHVVGPLTTLLTACRAKNMGVFAPLGPIIAQYEGKGRHLTESQKVAIAREIKRAVRANAGNDWQYYVRLASVVGGAQKLASPKTVAKTFEKFEGGHAMAAKSLRYAYHFETGESWWSSPTIVEMTNRFLRQISLERHVSEEQIEGLALYCCYLYASGAAKLSQYERPDQVPQLLLDPERREGQVAAVRAMTRLALKNLQRS